MPKPCATRSFTIALASTLAIGLFGYVVAGLLGAIGLVAGVVIYIFIAEILGLIAEAIDAYERNNRGRRGIGLDGDWDGGDNGWDFD